MPILAGVIVPRYGKRFLLLRAVSGSGYRLYRLAIFHFGHWKGASKEALLHHFILFVEQKLNIPRFGWTQVYNSQNPAVAGSFQFRRQLCCSRCPLTSIRLLDLNSDQLNLALRKPALRLMALDRVN